MKPVKDVPKARKKRIMTDDQKEKLAQARKKALVVRRENARIKKEEKELIKMKKQQDLDALRQSVKGTPAPKKVNISPVVEETIIHEPPIQKKVVVEQQINPSNNGFNEYKYTQDDVDRISLNAVENYDKIRKSRKAEKDELKQKEETKEKERQRLLNIVTGSKTVGHTDFWGNCY
tara:strand:- start:493 stop:1020 length:528 start_codon:yes stop_codon:yes gene_type:complete